MAITEEGLSIRIFTHVQIWNPKLLLHNNINTEQA